MLGDRYNPAVAPTPQGRDHGSFATSACCAARAAVGSLDIMNYRFAYSVGFHPWEDAASDPPFVNKFSELLDREEKGRQPPYGTALDLGTGSGIWGIELAKRGALGLRARSLPRDALQGAMGAATRADGGHSHLSRRARWRTQSEGGEMTKRRQNNELRKLCRFPRCQCDLWRCAVRTATPVGY